MKQLHRLLSLVLILTVCSIHVQAQKKDMAAQENGLFQLYSRLSEYPQANWDSVGFYSKKFTSQFTALIRSNPATLAYPFQKLTDNNAIQIQISADSSFRIYSWDTYTGGTMRVFNTVYQWRNDGKVFTRSAAASNADAGSFVSQLHTVEIKGKPYYLAVTNAIFSTKDLRQSIKIYTISNGLLVDTAKLFKTKTKRLNSIDVDFDFFSVVDRPERPLVLISYDAQQKIVYIPVVDGKGAVTSKNILYQLKDSGFFEFIGIETGKRK